MNACCAMVRHRSVDYFLDFRQFQMIRLIMSPFGSVPAGTRSSVSWLFQQREPFKALAVAAQGWCDDLREAIIIGLRSDTSHDEIAEEAARLLAPEFDALADALLTRALGHGLPYLPRWRCSTMNTSLKLGRTQAACRTSRRVSVAAGNVRVESRTGLRTSSAYRSQCNAGHGSVLVREANECRG